MLTPDKLAPVDSPNKSIKTKKAKHSGWYGLPEYAFPLGLVGVMSV